MIESRVNKEQWIEHKEDGGVRGRRQQEACQGNFQGRENSVYGLKSVERKVGHHSCQRHDKCCQDVLNEAESDAWWQQNTHQQQKNAFLEVVLHGLRDKRRAH